jgi:hypothetical protein
MDIVERVFGVFGQLAREFGISFEDVDVMSVVRKEGIWIHLLACTGYHGMCIPLDQKCDGDPWIGCNCSTKGT